MRFYNSVSVAYKGHSIKYNYLTFNFKASKPFGIYIYKQFSHLTDLFIIMGVCQQGSVAILWTVVGDSNRSLEKNL